MAKRVLTSAEKEILSTNPRFAQETKWAILNKAEYWSGQDGASPPLGNRDKWRRSKTFGNNIVLPNPNNYGTSLDINNFMLNIKDMAVVEDSVSITDPSQFDNIAQTATINYMLNNGGNPPYNAFEALAEVWFDEKITSWL